MPGYRDGMSRACMNREFWPWNSHHAWGGGYRDFWKMDGAWSMGRGTPAMGATGAATLPTPLISAATQYREDPSEERNLAFSVAGVSLGAECTALLIFQKSACHHLLSPSQGRNLALTDTA